MSVERGTVSSKKTPVKSNHGTESTLRAATLGDHPGRSDAPVHDAAMFEPTRDGGHTRDSAPQ
jgi:hypothetical protein